MAEVEGEVAGFAFYGPRRELDGYRHTVEDSVYVRDGRHGLGIGSALLTALIAGAREAGHHVMIADIESGNTASIRLRADLDVARTVGRDMASALDERGLSRCSRVVLGFHCVAPDGEVHSHIYRGLVIR